MNSEQGEGPKNLENSIVQRFRKNQSETISTSKMYKVKDAKIVSDQFKNLNSNNNSSDEE